MKNWTAISWVRAAKSFTSLHRGQNGHDPRQTHPQIDDPCRSCPSDTSAMPAHVPRSQTSDNPRPFPVRDATNASARPTPRDATQDQGVRCVARCLEPCFAGLMIALMMVGTTPAGSIGIRADRPAAGADGVFRGGGITDNDSPTRSVADGVGRCPVGTPPGRRLWRKL